VSITGADIAPLCSIPLRYFSSRICVGQTNPAFRKSRTYPVCPNPPDRRFHLDRLHRAGSRRINRQSPMSTHSRERRSHDRRVKHLDKWLEH